MIADAEQVPFREVRDGTVGKVVVLREPVGVTAGVTPWNSPVMVAVTKLFPSLLMGCPVVLKPAPESPLSGYVLAEAVAAAGLAEGVLSIVNGGVEVGAYLVGHPGVDFVTFTGSPGGGRAIATACGDRLRPVMLELGGKSAAVILPGADMAPYLALAGRELAAQQRPDLRLHQPGAGPRGRPGHGGRAAGRLRRRAMKIGDPHDPDTDFGPLAAARQRDNAERFIASGMAEGAKVVLGGGRPADQPKGWYVEPTVFVDVDNRMEIAQEEIFGPVLSVITYRDEAEAVAIANDSKYGLGGAVFADDVADGLASPPRSSPAPARSTGARRPAVAARSPAARSPGSAANAPSRAWSRSWS